MRLFGGILPFIGFRQMPVELKHALGLPKDQKISCFMVEWFGYGYIVGLY